MPRAAFLACLALLVSAAAVPAQAAGPLFGTVKRGWVSTSRSGHPLTRVPTNAKQLVASFEWARAPTPGLALTIDWLGPGGELRARWKDRTQKGDRPGTILWTSVARKTLAAAPGTWHVVLKVDGRSRKSLSLAVPR
jgi:hypothetical protein